MVDDGADILGPDMGVFQLARRAGAFALVRGIIGDGHEPRLRQPGRIGARRLLLHAAAGMGDDDGRIAPRRVEPLGQVDDRRKGDCRVVGVGETDFGHCSLHRCAGCAAGDGMNMGHTYPSDNPLKSY